MDTTEDIAMEDTERKRIKATLVGWRYNTGNKHSPKWLHPQEVPQDYSMGGPITLTQWGKEGQYWLLPSRFCEGAARMMHYNYDRREPEVLVVHEDKLWVCRHRGELKPLTFMAGKLMKHPKTGAPASMSPEAFTQNMGKLIECHRKVAELYQQMYASVAIEYGEW
jgi:hypothetical protein